VRIELVLLSRDRALRLMRLVLRVSTEPPVASAIVDLLVETCGDTAGTSEEISDGIEI